MARKKLSKSEKIRNLLDKGVDRNQIVKDLGVSPQLVYIVAKKGGYAKKAKKAKKPSKILKAVKQMNRQLNRVKVKENWETTRQMWNAMKNQYGDSTSEVMDQLVNPKPIFGEVTDTPDLVNSPPHYTEGGFETIDFIEAKDLNYRLGNVIKYVSRAGRKAESNPVEDLEKAAWYLNREIEARRSA